MRDPLPLFDARYYVAQTGPLPSDTSPLLHYITIGALDVYSPFRNRFGIVGSVTWERLRSSLNRMERTA